MAKGTYSELVALGTIALTTWLAVTWKRRPSFGDHPLQTIIFTLFITGVCLLVASRRHALFRNKSSPAEDYAAIPLRDVGHVSPRSSFEGSSKRADHDTPSPRRRRYQFLFIIGTILVRIEILRRILQNIQCSQKGTETILLPIFLIVYDAFATQKSLIIDPDIDTISNSVFEDIYDGITRSKWRYVLPTIVFSFGSYLAANHALHSTTICSLSQRQNYYIPFLQVVGAFLDAVILIACENLVKDIREDRLKCGALGAILVSSAGLLGVFGTAIHILGTVGTSQPLNLMSTFVESLVLAMVVLAFIFLSFEVRYWTLAIWATFICTYTPLIVTAWSDRKAFPPQHNASKVMGLIFIFMGFTFITQLYKSSEAFVHKSRFTMRIPVLLWVLLTTSFLFAEITFMWRRNGVGFHPVEFLMYNAQINSDHWLRQASSSESLKRAAIEYKERYGRDPPPNFDKWYAFAKERNSVIVDDYDQIYRDLLPFWAMPPFYLRNHITWQDSVQGLAFIIIRNGQATAHLQGLDATWVSEETLKTINLFAQWLPDMQLAINTNPEPRVITPWKIVEKLRREGTEAATKFEMLPQVTPTWTAEQDWAYVIDENQPASAGPESSATRARHEELIAQSCPPSSLMARGKIWYSRDFCAGCAYPHSIGQFVSNWTMYTDLCHQPDLGHLHTFLGEPSRNLISSQKMIPPIFSTKRIDGYNDILFPGPHDYLDPPQGPSTDKSFDEREDTLFWRGPSGDADRSIYSWHGLQQQRFTHLANNQTSKNLIPMLLPSSSGKYIYENVPAVDLIDKVRMNIGISNFTGCVQDQGCSAQSKELGRFPDSQFNAHWSYRYLFVMDEDPGPSDFLSVLGSNSLPFRSSLFRAWYDYRLTPWLHFVPQDVRLHSVHSTLAYFVGLKGNINGRDIDMPPMTGEAAFIASQGQKWAQRVVRREDMEVYMFRLLLEWARVVDDQRNVLGYRYEEEHQ